MSAEGGTTAGRPAERVGVWLVGARGSVATTAVAGCAAVSRGLAAPTGMVTSLPAFDAGPLPDPADFVFGGHDLADIPLRKVGETLGQAGVIPWAVVGAVGDALDSADAEVRPGITATGMAPLEAVERVQRDLAAFRSAYDLARLVVINCASTEQPVAPDSSHLRLDALEDALAAHRPVLPASSLYAYAALDAGIPFVDFTPSTGARLPALEALALGRGVPHAGRDGKTGETGVKSALAAMFADRNLAVRVWAGSNLLGGGDGAALSDPERAESKRRSKSLALDGILGRSPDVDVHIAFVPELGEWKTAWDLVTFEGFLGTRMRLQFTWEGADSSLAAPLVLDLARLMAAAQAAGHSGPLAPLAFFFKDPVGTSEHRLDRQFAALATWAASLHSDARPSPPQSKLRRGQAR